MHYFNINKILLVFFTLLCFQASAQLRWSEQNVNYGVFTKYTERVSDIVIWNEGTKTDHLLRADFSINFQVLYSTKDVQPGDSLVIRVKFNPRKTGKFKEVIPVFFSSQNVSTPLTISAEVTYVNLTEDQPCPHFNEKPTQCCGEFSLDVLVLDKATKKPIRDADVEVLEQRQLQLSKKTNNDGEVNAEIPIGYYTLYAGKEGYSGESLTTQVNLHNHRFVFELEKKEAPLPPVVIVPIDSIPSVVVTEPIPNRTFDEKEYVPNNISFLIDISGSMAQGEKWPITQQALSSLSGVMRATDQLSVLTYSEKAKVLLNTTKGNEVSDLGLLLEGKKPNGQTSGTAGFNAAFRMLRKSKIDAGNNQLYVITDGAFKPEDEWRIEKLVRLANKRNIHTTVIVVKGSKFAKENLEKISQFGEGSFLCIENAEDAQSKIFELIKQQSKK
jgi:Mg-chelatase subunit ChlD